MTPLSQTLPASLSHSQLGVTEDSQPLVSVIVSNYNYARFLPQAIASVLQQTYKKFELIVVDDGSTDNSRAVIESYGAHLTAIFQQNSGQGAAFNAGFERSQGEIICFLDADDYFYPDKLANVVASFAEHPDWVQISHGWTAINGEGAVTGNSTRTMSRGDVRQLLLQHGKYSWGITSGLSYRRQVLEQVLPIPPKPRAADTYLTAAVPFHGNVGGIDAPLMFYRMHGKNRRAHSDNLPYLIEQRQQTTDCINRAAQQTGLDDRFDIQRDVDYRSLKAIERGERDWSEVGQVLWLSLQESVAIRRGPLDSLNRLVQRGICATFPGEGKALLRLGLRRYLRSKFPGGVAH